MSDPRKAELQPQRTTTVTCECREENSRRVLVGTPYPDGIQEVHETTLPDSEKLRTRIIAWFSGVFGALLVTLSVYAMSAGDQAMVNRVFGLVELGVYGALVWAGFKALKK